MSGMRMLGMRMRAPRRGTAVFPVVVFLAACGADETPAPDLAVIPGLSGALVMDLPLVAADVVADTAAALEILAIEDARSRDPADLEWVFGFVAHAGPGIRRIAVRALGRLEDPTLLDMLTPALADPEPVVRAEAANAIAQAVFSGDGQGGGVERAMELLRGALDTESDPGARGAIARSIGRLRGGDFAVRAGILVDVAAIDIAPLDADGMGAGAARVGVTESGADDRLLGVARGALFLFRSPGVAGWSGPERTALEGVLEALASDGGNGAGDAVRRAAAAARAAAGNPPTEWVSHLLGDPEPEVRRIAASIATEPEALRRALADADARVRVEGVRGWLRSRVEIDGCAPIEEAANDPSDHVAITALDALGVLSCGPEATARLAARLAAEAEGLSGDPDRWHRPIRALRALARHDPVLAEAHLPSAAAHESPFVRAHAARIAADLGDGDLLTALAVDPSPNVREAAIAGLAATSGRDADPIIIRQLSGSDPQLVRNAARLLAGSPPSPELTEALFASLERFTAAGRSTDRDPRVALLERIGDVATDEEAARLASWLDDPDPRVAELASELLQGRTGEEHPAAPTGLRARPLPTWDRLVALQAGEIVLEMEGGGLDDIGIVRIGLLPFEAPTSADRFVELVERGRLDGLTLHRVVANFVVQGGSPGANEYAGHGPYTRDELGRVGHWRGTVGVSTRGRDTGDGQLFVNLVDNLRLDHDYTVFGFIRDGMDIVAELQEGVRIRSARWLDRPGGDADR